MERWALVLYRSILIMGILLSGNEASTQKGRPLITNFPHTAYKSSQYVSDPQNWCVVQNAQGLILVGNMEGTLAFDGKLWKPVTGTAGKNLYKMAVGANGVVYVGGKKEFGYLAADSSGNLVFISLADRVSDTAKGFEFLSNVVCDEQGNTLFQDRYWAFVWNGQSLRTWKSLKQYRKAFSVGGTIYLRSQDDGLWILQEDKLQKLPHSEVLDKLNIRGIHETHPGNPSRLLLITMNDGLFEYSDGQVTKRKSNLDSVTVWNTMDLPDGKIALATGSKGLRILNRASGTFSTITESEGLFSNSLIYANVDAEGGIWVTSQIGVSRVDQPEAILPQGGLTESKFFINTMLQYHDRLLLGTDNGCKEIFSSGRATHYEQMGFTRNFVGNFLPFQDDVLVAASMDGIIWYHEQTASKVSSVRAHTLYASKRQPNRIFVGAQDGLYSILWDKGHWKEEGKIEGVEQYVYHIDERPNGDLWVGQDIVSRVHFPNGFTNTPEVTTFDSTQGFTEDHIDFDPFTYQDKLYFGTNRGFFHFDEAQQKLVPDATFGERFADHGHGARHAVEDLHGQIWLHDGERTGVLKKDKQGQWQWDDLPLRRMEDQDVWTIYPSPDSLIWLGTTTTLYCYDPRIPKDYHVPYHTLVDRVTINDSTIVFYGNYGDENGLITDVQPERYKLTFPCTQNNIAFSYTATSYEYPEKTEFSHWLEGLEEEWSSWGKSSDKSYNGLPEGTYTFHARSKNLYDTLGKEAAYTFTILPPWHRTWWAYLIYGSVAVGIVVLIVRWQVRRANRKQEAARALERKQQRAMLQVTVETQESERMRIARDLHDEVGALLSTVKMSLKLSQRRLAKEGVDTTLDESTGLLDSAIGSVREISHDLLPPSLESLGLAAALAQLVEKTASLTGIPFDCKVTGAPQRLPIRTELTLYRMVQELISNSLKHSQATQRGLELFYEAHRLRILFQDNGVGFDYAAIKENGKGLGLRGIESRADALGGTLQIQTAPTQGLKAILEIPV